jgi:hypothetical protein
MILVQINQNSVVKKSGWKNWSMRRPSSIASGRQRKPHEIEPVARAEAEMRPVQDVAIAADDVCPVVEWVALVEGEEVILDGNCRIARRGDRREQIEPAPELRVKVRVKDGASRQDVACHRTASE